MHRNHAAARTSESRTASAPVVERYVVDGRVYRWEEGTRSENTARSIAPREDLPSLFTRTVVPQIEGRGARGLAFAAATLPGVPGDDVRWVAWRAPGDEAPVWGLYAATRWLGGNDSAQSAPANDTLALIAWGDGAALAWADDRESARALLRAALRTPPVWAERGIRSRDATFPVSVDLVRRSRGRKEEGQLALALVPSTAPRDVAAQPASPDVLLGIVRAWRARHASELRT